MADSEGLRESLKPFYQRASEAEDRLGKLEAALSSKKGNYGDSETGNVELLKLVSELQKKLEDSKADHVAEKEKALKEVKKLATESAKLQYRITHLVRALKDTDCKSVLG